MSSHKMKYTIYPDRIYILEYETGNAEVLGSEILGYMYGIYGTDYLYNDIVDNACTFGIRDQDSEVGKVS
jgi:hypothetical protein